MSDPIFGLKFQTVDEEVRPVLGADLSVIGIIGPAPGRSKALYPHLNAPYLINSKDSGKISALGPRGPGNYIRDALDGINDQLSAGDNAATCVVVFSDSFFATTDPAVRIQRIIRGITGDSTLGTGMWAFTKAPHQLGVTPRLLLAPGFTQQMANQIYRITLTHAGRGYDPENPPHVTFAGGGTSPEIQQAAGYAVVDDGSLTGPGRITKIVLTKPGLWYTTPPTVTIAAPPGGVDAGPPPRIQAVATATLIARANPVVAELPAVLEQLMGHAFVESAGTSERLDKRWRSQINSKRLIPLSGGIMVTDPISGAPIPMPLAPRATGALIRRDYETGAPFHSAANQPLGGVIGVVRPMKFSITDGDNESQRLLAANIGIIARGEVGNDTSIASGGYILIATDNAGDDELWRFYNVTRGRDYIHISLLKALRYFLGRYNITGQAVQAIINTMQFFLRDLQADQHILGYNVNFQGELNSPEEIRQGHLTISFAAEEPPVLRKITTMSARYRPAIDAMVADLAKQFNAAA
jgi:phage tail sheath protein FI